MDALNPGVLNAFGLSGHVIGQKKDKSSFVCQTSKGVKIIQKTRLNAETVGFIHYTKEKLSESGFRNTDRFIETRNGAPYVEISGEKYVAFDRINGRETRFDDRADFLGVVRAASYIHFLTRQPKFFEAACLPRPAAENINFSAELLKRQLKEMTGFKKTVLKQSKFSDFDVLFLKNFEDYEESLKKSVSILEKDEIAGIFSSLTLFSHNLLKDETAIFSEGEIFITNFSECSADSFLLDLASLIKRHLKAGKNHIPLEEILSVYSEVNPLNGAELEALYAILLVQDKLYKLCARYYAKKRTWTPLSFTGIMDGINSGRDAQIRYIEGYLGNLLYK